MVVAYGRKYYRGTKDCYIKIYYPRSRTPVKLALRFLLKPIPRPIVFIEGIDVLMLPFSLLKLEDQFDQTP